jgi:hypothetical protein
MVAVGADCWTLHVMGIHPFRRTLWIQLHRAPDSEPGLVLKVSASTRLEEALDALHGFQWHESGLQVVDATTRHAPLILFAFTSPPLAPHSGEFRGRADVSPRFSPGVLETAQFGAVFPGRSLAASPLAREEVRGPLRRLPAVGHSLIAPGAPGATRTLRRAPCSTWLPESSRTLPGRGADRSLCRWPSTPAPSAQ